MNPGERNLQTLKETVEAIYDVISRTEFHIASQHSNIRPILPERITFITAEELCARYPELHPRQREDRICAERKAVFVIGIGGQLPDGQPHDGRAPDYDDWTTPHSAGGRGLNGDILLWHPVLERAFEISSMGIRVDPPTLLRQLAERQLTERQELPFHRLALGGPVAADDGRRDRPVAFVHVLSPHGPCGRSGLRHLAGRDGAAMCVGQHHAVVISLRVRQRTVCSVRQ